MSITDVCKKRALDEVIQLDDDGDSLLEPALKKPFLGDDEASATVEATEWIEGGPWQTWNIKQCLFEKTFKKTGPSALDFKARFEADRDAALEVFRQKLCIAWDQQYINILNAMHQHLEQYPGTLIPLDHVVFVEANKEMANQWATDPNASVAQMISARYNFLRSMIGDFFGASHREVESGVLIAATFARFDSNQMWALCLARFWHPDPLDWLRHAFFHHASQLLVGSTYKTFGKGFDLKIKKVLRGKGRPRKHSEGVYFDIQYDSKVEEWIEQIQSAIKQSISHISFYGNDVAGGIAAAKRDVVNVLAKSICGNDRHKVSQLYYPSNRSIMTLDPKWILTNSLY